MKKDDHWLSFYVVTNKYASPFRYSTISEPPSFELPYTLSTNVIGTWKQAQDSDQLKCERSINYTVSNLYEENPFWVHLQKYIRKRESRQMRALHNHEYSNCS